MSIGQIILILVSVLVAAGVCQRALDRLRLTDRQALLFVALIFIGGLLPDISIGRARVNVGGAKERLRALAATLVTAAAVYAIGRFFPNEPETMPFDVNYLYGIAAGLIAYVFGRSRRSAFIAGVAGMLLADVAQAVMLWTDGIDQTLRLGGAGMLDTIVISGVSAVLFAELLGEFIERCVRGAKRKEGARG